LNDITIREISYNKILDRIVESNDKWGIVHSVMDWVYVNGDQWNEWMELPRDTIGIHPFFNMIRGISWCDQKAEIIQRLIAVKGIESRLVFFPKHTILEVKIGDESRYIDGSYDCEWYLGDNQFIPNQDVAQIAIDALNECEPKYGDWFEYGRIRKVYRQILNMQNDDWLYLWTYVSLKIHHHINIEGYNIDEHWAKTITDSEYPLLYQARVLYLMGYYSQSIEIYDRLLDNPILGDEALNYAVRTSVWMCNDELTNHYLSMVDTAPEYERSYINMIDQWLERWNKVYAN